MKQIFFFFPTQNGIPYLAIFQKPPRSHTHYASDLPLSLLKREKPCFRRAFPDIFYQLHMQSSQNAVNVKPIQSS